MKRFSPFLATVLALLFLTGCGYHLMGSGSGGGERFALGSVDDRSREPLLGPFVRAKLATGVVERGGDGDLTLDVVLYELSESARAYVAGDIPREYLLTLTSDFTIRRGENIVWKETGVRVFKEFQAGADVNATRANKELVLKVIAEKLTDKILYRASVVVGRLSQ